MNNVFRVILAGLLLLVTITHSKADENIDEEIKALKEHLEEVQRENQLQINQLKRKIDELEATQAYNPRSSWTNNIETAYKEGFFIKTTDNRFSLKFQIKSQFRFFVMDFDNKKQNNTETSFQIKRLKFVAKGNAFFPWLEYKLQIEFTENDEITLEDYYVDLTRYEAMSLRLGQFKVPFDRERLTSSFALEFIDRSIISKEFSFNRDIGTMPHGKVFKSMFDFAAGIFNGAGRNETINTNHNFLYAGRFMYTPFGDLEYVQGSLNNTQKPLLAIAMAVALLPDFDAETEGGTDRKNLSEAILEIGATKANVFQYTADIAFKYLGFSGEAEYDMRKISPVDNNIDDVLAYGFRVQSGYFIIPEQLEIATRYAFLDPNGNESNDISQEFTTAISYYIYRNRLKIQFGYSFLLEDNPEGDYFRNNEFAVQMQTIF